MNLVVVEFIVKIRGKKCDHKRTLPKFRNCMVLFIY